LKFTKRRDAPRDLIWFPQNLLHVPARLFPRSHQTSRHKVVKISGLAPQEVLMKLQQAA
jgi:hypothetical protein